MKTGETDAPSRRDKVVSHVANEIAAGYWWNALSRISTYQTGPDGALNVPDFVFADQPASQIFVGPSKESFGKPRLRE